MKPSLPLAVLIAVISTAAHAAPLLETYDESRQRHSAERYEQYERNGRTAPLGGYNDKLGDPSPVGTERPGYVSPQPYGSGNGIGRELNGGGTNNGAGKHGRF